MAISPRKFTKNLVGYLVSARWLLGVLGLAFISLWLLLWLAEAGGSKSYGPYESLYLAFISALTIGYGDLAPVTILGRVVAIALGFLGILFTGIVVAAAITALPDSED